MCEKLGCRVIVQQVAGRVLDQPLQQAAAGLVPPPPRPSWSKRMRRKKSER